MPLETSQPNCSAGRVGHIGRPRIFGAFAAKNPERFLKDFRFYGGPSLFAPCPVCSVTRLSMGQHSRRCWFASAKPIGCAGIVAALACPQTMMNCHGHFCEKQ